MKKAILFILAVLLFSCYSVSAVEDKKGEPENSSPLILESVAPVFPVKAENDHIEGFVTIKFTVGKYGKLTNSDIVEAVPQGYFEESALTALKGYRFKAAIKNGEPVDYTLELPFIFAFPNNSLEGDVKTKLQTYREINKGIELLNKKDYPNALKYLTEAIKLQPEYTTAHYYRSVAYNKLDEYDKALTDIDKAIGDSSKVFAYYNQRGLIYILRKEYKKAVDNFNESLKIEPNLVGYIHRGDCYRELEEYKKSIEDYTEALVMDESLIHVNNNRGFVFYKLKDNENACLDFKQACKLGDCRAFDHLKERGVCK